MNRNKNENTKKKKRTLGLFLGADETNKGRSIYIGIKNNQADVDTDVYDVAADS